MNRIEDLFILRSEYCLQKFQTFNIFSRRLLKHPQNYIRMVEVYFRFICNYLNKYKWHCLNLSEISVGETEINVFYFDCFLKVFK